MINSRCTSRRPRQWSAGAGLVGGAVIVAMLGAVGAPTARADDLASDIGLAAASSNQFDPAVIPYSPDPSNLFAPVYTIAPVGPEEAISTVTDPNNLDTTDTFGTQDFSLSTLGFPVDSFTGNVEYTPTPFDDASGLSGILSQLGQELGLSGGYSEEITTLGGTGIVLPDEPTSFLISEYGFGYGNVFEESMNSAGTSATVGDFVLTPFGNENITPIVDLFLPQGVGINGLAAGAVSAAANGTSIPAATPAELLSDASTNYTDANQLLSAIPSGPDYSANIATTIDVQDKLLQGIANLGSAESALSSYDNGALSDLLNPWFASVNQGWDQVSEAALSSEQALESAVSTGSATTIETALAGTLGPVYEALGPAFQSDFVDIAAHLLTGIDPVTAGLDTASAVDPGIIADVLSSIGL